MMKLIQDRFNCPCCGWLGLSSPSYAHIGEQPWGDQGTPPYEERLGLPSYEVCACCGFEFGNDDNPGTSSPTSFSEYLLDWIKSGCSWFDETKKPSDWNLERQLKSVGIKQPTCTANGCSRC